jgi:excinuclease ABC subunit A
MKTMELSEMIDARIYYAQHGVMTDPGEYSQLLDGLPTQIPSLTRVIQGLLMHPFNTGLYDVELTQVQRKEVNIRPVREMLGLMQSLDNRPLTEPRPANERIVGNCRDHATLFCAMLRHQGVPARVRVGFATYFGPQMHYDHWITQYWDASQERWILVDPQIDDTQRQANQITFDTCDMNFEQFISAGHAWNQIRQGKAKSGIFGHNRHLRGIGYVRCSLIQELAALNKVEVLPWDNWWYLTSKQEDTVTAEDRSLLDHIAKLTENADENFNEIQSAYEDDPQFFLPVQSRLKVLGLLNGNGLMKDFVIAPSDSQLLAKFSDLELLDKQILPTKAIPAASVNPMDVPLDPDKIIVRGAQQHNLKHIDVTIPRYKLVVITGVSGSGKSSLAFDTLYAEGQRRYVESLSSYVRRYLEQMDKPKVDYIGGLSPAIAIEQKSVSKNPRSTVATVTEVMDYLRVLFSRAGIQHCPQCGRAVEQLSVQGISDRLLRLSPGIRFQLLAPIVQERRADVSALLTDAVRDGYTRARVDGIEHNLAESSQPDQKQPKFRKNIKHTVELIVDRLVVPKIDSENGVWKEYSQRLVDSVETTLRAGKGTLIVQVINSSNGSVAGSTTEEFMFSELNTCPHCEISLAPLTASLFSFNAPAGMCPDCNGLGTKMEVDPSLIIEHPELSILDGASRWHGNIRMKKNNWHVRNIQAIADHYGIDLEVPWNNLPQSFRDVILYGSGDEKIHFTFENQEGTWKGESTNVVRGVIFHINRLFRQTQSEYTRRWYMSFMSQQPCPSCNGTRLCMEARTVMVGDKTFPEVLEMTLEQAHAWILSLRGIGEGHRLSADKIEVVGEVLKELENRLSFTLNVGLHYLTLNRPAPTLSGGEGQRIRLASQLGCGLVGVLYILDEPSIGLHARDQRTLIDTLIRLRDLGNTILVVEHDAETMKSADWIIDLGPGAGELGGEIVAAGTPEQIMKNPQSITGRYLQGELKVTAPNGSKRRQPNGWLTIHGARLFNLKSIVSSIPLGTLTCVTGVSGSGKSSLVSETLFPALQRQLHGAMTTPGPHDRIEGLDLVDKVIDITQDPIGRTPRSNPATYVGLFDDIRQVFAATPEARVRGYQPGRFSFNVKGGRCEACRGHGQKKIEMHFLPDVWVLCKECKGARYNRHTLEVTYKGKNIAQVLDMDVRQALVFFSAYPNLVRGLQTLYDVGLEYVKLGQPATTLSGGEAQRVKLAKELSRVSTGRTVYILDEPTTGLHFADIQRLLDVLHRLTDEGNTVIVIEHNLDVIKTADWIIDLGPEGGAGGGYIMAQGTPEQVAITPGSYTGKFLKTIL